MRRGVVALGVALAALGLLGLAVGGVPYTDERQLGVGPLEATVEVEREREIPPLLAGLVLAAGVGLAVWGATRKR